VDGSETTETHEVPGQRRSAPPASPLSGRVLPRGVAQVRPEAPAAVLMVDLEARQVLYANEVAAQMAPSLALPVSADEWAAAADLRDLDGEPLDETAHPLSRIARFEPVAGQGVSAARSSDLGERREPLWVVALPLDGAPNLRGHALVVFLPVRDRDELQERAEAAHARTHTAAPAPELQPAPSDAVAVREAAVLATGLSFTVADAGQEDLPLVWVNPAFTAVTGYTFEEAVGHNCRFLQGPGTDRATTQRMRDALDTGRSVTEVLLNFRADGTAFWNQVAMSPITDADGRVTHYVGIQTDVSGRVAADAERDRALVSERAARAAAEEAHSRLQLLAEVSTQLSATTDAHQACDRLVQLMVPSVADFAVLAVVGDDAVLASPGSAPTGGQVGPVVTTTAPSAPAAARLGLHDIAWHHHDPDLRDALDRHARGRLAALTTRGRDTLGLVTRPGSSRLGDDDAQRASELDTAEGLAGLMHPSPARDALAELSPTSMTTVALRSRERTLGVMTLGTGPGRAPLTDDDLALARDIAARAGLALDRARLYRQQRDLAAGLQRSLLHLSPNAAPEHVKVAVRYVAAAEAAQVGGDFYDVYAQPAGSAVVVIGDVMGHDTLAAAAMAQLRSIVRTLGMVGDDDPAQVLTRTDVLMRASGIDTPATASVVRLPPPDQQPEDERPSTVLEWSNAGHPPPLLIGADGDVRLLEAADTDLLLGIEPTTRRRLTRSRLRAGETLLLYTDGLVERRDQPLGEGIALLREVAARAASTTSDPEELADAVLAAMLPAPSSDDVAVVAVVLR